MIVIFSYNRYEWLLDMLRDLEDEEVVVIDDGSDFDVEPLRRYCDFYRFPHVGKPGFWRLWDAALKVCYSRRDDYFLFLQDDVKDIRLDTIKQATEGLDLFAFNIMRRGSDRGWVQKAWFEVELNGLPCYDMSYVDCIFSTNRKSLNKVGWYMDGIGSRRFLRPTISSGVGQQLSRRLHGAGIPMYMPEKSLAYHGAHESKMHPVERKNNPLVSR